MLADGRCNRGKRFLPCLVFFDLNFADEIIPNNLQISFKQTVQLLDMCCAGYVRRVTREEIADAVG